MNWIPIVLVLTAQAAIAGDRGLPAPPNAEELNAHSCARLMAGMMFPLDQSGPLFSEGGLTFTSVNASDGSRLLIVSAGLGLYGIPLLKAGVNRLRIRVPAPNTESGSLDYYIGYLHGGLARSRVFEFSAKSPPPGRDELDYSMGFTFRAQNLLPHFEFAIHETINRMVVSVTEGKVDLSHVKWQPSDQCDYLEKRYPALAKAIKRDMSDLHLLSSRPRVAGSRMPASVSSKKPGT